MIRQAFEAMDGRFGDTVTGVPAQARERTALGEWSVRDLIGHTRRAILTVDASLDTLAEAGGAAGQSITTGA